MEELDEEIKRRQKDLEESFKIHTDAVEVIKKLAEQYGKEFPYVDGDISNIINKMRKKGRW